MPLADRHSYTTRYILGTAFFRKLFILQVLLLFFLSIPFGHFVERHKRMTLVLQQTADIVILKINRAKKEIIRLLENENDTEKDDDKVILKKINEF